MRLISKKINLDNSSSREQNSRHVFENRRSSRKGSLSTLKARILNIYKTPADMIDIAEYEKVTVQTDRGVYEASDCDKRHIERQKPDQPASATLYGAECRIEGHVCNIKGFLDRNEDALQPRTSDREE